MHFPKLIHTALLALVLTVTGCSNSNPESGVDSSQAYNDTDVTFATDMIKHHAQALEMVDLTMDHKLDPTVAALAEEIRFAQAPEVEQMVGFLNKWDYQPIPETSRDHANAHGDGDMEMDASMPGMMSSEDMEALEETKNPEFQTRWLEMMIQHHEGAIEMASTEADDGEDKAAVALAEDIIRTQGDQVKTMQNLVDG